MVKMRKIECQFTELRQTGRGTFGGSVTFCIDAANLTCTVLFAVTPERVIFRRGEETLLNFDFCGAGVSEVDFVILSTFLKALATYRGRIVFSEHMIVTPEGTVMPPVKIGTFEKVIEKLRSIS